MPLRTAVYYAQVLDFQAFLRLRARKTEVAKHAAYLWNLVWRINRPSTVISSKRNASASEIRNPVIANNENNVQ
jgi:hypothetical protein